MSYKGEKHMTRDEELRKCVKEFFEKYLNYREESESGRMFSPVIVSCCRAMMTEPLNDLLERMRELSGSDIYGGVDD